MSSESQGSMRECQIHLMELDDTHCQPGRAVHKDTQNSYLPTVHICMCGYYFLSYLTPCHTHNTTHLKQHIHNRVHILRIQSRNNNAVVGSRGQVDTPPQEVTNWVVCS